MTNRYSGAAIAAVLALLCGPAFADDSVIVVTGDGLPVAEGDEAFSRVVLDIDEIVAAPGQRIEEVLARVAGFGQFRRADSRSVHPTAQGASLRGLGGNAASRATVTIDGVPLADPFGGWVNWTAVDPSRLRRVTITRGGGIGSFAPGALAGTIAMESAMVPATTDYRGALAYGSRDSVTAGIGLAGPMGGGGGSASFRYDRGDGFVPIVARQRGSADRAAPYRQFSANVRGVAPLGAGELQVALAGFDDRRDRGVDFTDNRTRGGDFSLRFVARGALPVEVLGYVNLRQFETSFASVDVARSAATQVLDQQTPALGFGAKAELRPVDGADAALHVGGDVRVQDGETREGFTFVSGVATRLRRAGGRNSGYGLYANGHLRIAPKVMFTGGVRGDRWVLGDGRLTEVDLLIGQPLTQLRYADRHGWEGTGRLGLAVEMSPVLRVRTAAYNSFRLPTLNELYRPFRVGADGTAANPALRPERLRGVEAGIDFAPASGATLSLTGFWNRLDNAIANVTVVRQGFQCPGVGFVRGNCQIRRNLDHVTVKGVEADLSVNLAPFTLMASASWQDAEVHDRGASAALNGFRPAQVPRFGASSTIVWENAAGYAASLSARYVGTQYEDDLETQPLRRYLTLDAVARVPVLRGLSFELRAENLTDQRIETGISGDGVVERAQPRTIWLGIRLTGNDIGRD